MKLPINCIWCFSNMTRFVTVNVTLIMPKIHINKSTLLGLTIILTVRPGYHTNKN